ncbi:Phytoalexin-deficient 4-2 protein [Dorcoceras hygrometricum]|uniref:Phytoalexin-deficient 4-2 protein n=1 Tax=Dorcoceras hygrometricum TaxID=472368 RepID=A0A2Z7BYH2_9LAMI|nr:Phytoalexin-deficient 4-2 protein [Dorcoceras hygrometricum]
MNSASVKNWLSCMFNGLVVCRPPSQLIYSSTYIPLDAMFPCENHESSTCVTLNGSGIQLAVGPQPLWLRNHNFGLAQRIMVKRLATSPHDPLGITDSACKNQLVVVSVQYGPFNTYIPIRSTTIGKPIYLKHIQYSGQSLYTIIPSDSIGYPRMRASGESSTTKHRLLHASGPHPIPPPNDPKLVGKRVKVRRLSCRVSMTFRVVRTNQYNQDLGLIHSTNGNHLESLNEGSSIDHQVTIHLHAQNITMFPTNETMVLRIADASLKLGWPPNFDGPID